MAIFQSKQYVQVLLLTGLLFQGFSGIYGGLSLVIDPSGGSIGLPLSLLAGTPFGSYLLPGWILGVLLGAGPLVAAGALVAHTKWALLLSALLGAALLLWIVVQVILVGYLAWPPLQLVYGLLGVALVSLSVYQLRH